MLHCYQQGSSIADIFLIQIGSGVIKRRQSNNIPSGCCVTKHITDRGRVQGQVSSATNQNADLSVNQ